MKQAQAVTIWKRFHWSFFVNTQGILIALGRFREALKQGDIESAKIELNSAADLLRAAGAAMEMAGSFSSHEYEDEVRPTMLPPKVGVAFSGLMSWDHAVLIRIWKHLKPDFENLPPELRAEHEDFIRAYGFLASSHRAVCKRFGGNTGGSLRTENEVATAMLDRFTKSRLGMIDPGHSDGCPVQ
ncbi:MAG: siderophore biosynthesis protein [Verrucomicrobiota bacterium]